MSDPNPQQPEKKVLARTPEQIARFLEQTGFVFEMRMNEVFLKAGYATDINEQFLDLEDDTLREIDIIASKVVNGINLHFVVECKQSATDKWIFICNKSMPRFYYSVKHLPRVAAEILKEKKLFSGFHSFNRKVPLGYNYLCYTIAGNKKAEHRQIDECVYKLPKALVDLASRADGGKHLFFPIALFSGQMFSVLYKGHLVVEEKSFLQYYVSFETEIYRRAPEQNNVPLSSLFRPVLAELEKLSKASREERIRYTTRELSPYYQIDFVTEAGLPDFLALIEKHMAALRTSDWPMPGVPKGDQKLPEHHNPS
jgi:hypothetical protein